MPKSAALLVAAASLLAAGFAVVAERSPGLVVHEWGTFTTVAGLDALKDPAFIARMRGKELSELTRKSA